MRDNLTKVVVLVLPRPTILDMQHKLRGLGTAPLAIHSGTCADSGILSSIITESDSFKIVGHSWVIRSSIDIFQYYRYSAISTSVLCYLLRGLLSLSISLRDCSCIGKMYGHSWINCSIDIGIWLTYRNHILIAYKRDTYIYTYR